jgi:hypothetical protein
VIAFELNEGGMDFDSRQGQEFFLLFIAPIPVLELMKLPTQ